MKKKASYHSNIYATNKTAVFSNVSDGSQDICLGAKYYLWYKLVIWCLCKWKYMEGVISVKKWQRSVIFLFSTYIYGKTTTKFANLKTLSCSAHHSGPRLVNNWKRNWKKFFFNSVIYHSVLPLGHTKPKKGFFACLSSNQQSGAWGCWESKVIGCFYLSRNKTVPTFSFHSKPGFAFYRFFILNERYFIQFISICTSTNEGEGEEGHITNTLG